MFLKKIHVENFRLLMNYDVNLDEELTLFVGKNNAGKTSLMNLMDMVVSGSNLVFDDYPIPCRQKIYQAFADFWCGKISFEDCINRIPITKMRLCIDYSKESEIDYLGGLSPFIIDLDEKVAEAVILAKYSFSATDDILYELKKSYEDMKRRVEDAGNGETDIKKVGVEAEGYTELNIEILSKIIEQNFSSLFSLHIIAVNPTDTSNTQEKTKKEIRDLFVLATISAERSLDEADNVKEKPLSAVMNRLFKSDVSEIEEEIATQTQSLKEFVEHQSLNAENKVNDILSNIVSNMASFGYPTAEDMQLYARTQFSMKNDIINNTDLAYVTADNREALPSSHNGLGYKNLIKITLLLKEFARNVKQNAKSAIPILFLEEPEAHMHPQLQEVFVGHLKDVLSELSGNPIQIVMSTHSPHIANTVPFKNIRYLRRKADRVICKNLNEFCEEGKAKEEHKENMEFLRKYLTLSRCDLYFCDKAILVEGAAERLLIPDMIKKCERLGKFKGSNPPLTSQYCSIIEVGGAYAHRFFGFVDFLEIPTLILTDIDFVGADQNKSLKKDAKDTSNATIKKWCHDVFNIAVTKKIELDRILKLSKEQKTNGLRHLEFQMEENGTYPRSLEEALMNVNRKYYKIDEEETNINFEETEGKKTDFALDLIFGEMADSYSIPSYIENGLVWLNEQSKAPETIAPKRKFKRAYNLKK